VDKNEVDFPWLWWLLSFILLVIFFVVLHLYWIGPPFESFLSFIVTIYLLVCAWAFPNIRKELGQIVEGILKNSWSFLISRGMYFVFWLFAPFMYVYFNFIEKE
jgi:hypothetical protein